MIKIVRQNLLLKVPLILSVVMTFILVFLIESSVLQKTNGVFMYPLDDPFIHMQVAKNIAFHSTWGINPGEFASASSSLLYSLLLAFLFKLFSANVLIPFFINCVAAFFLLFTLDNWMRRQDVNPVWRTIFLLLIVFFVPLPVIITSGMEHTLQCLFCFLFITEFAQWLEQNGKNKKSNIPWALLIYGILVTTIRYEGLFLIAIASLILFWYKKIGFAFLLGAASLAPLLIFGFYSVSVGSYFLPNSVLVKSETISFSLKGIVDFFSNTLIYKYSVVKDQSPSPSTPPPGISLLAAQRLLLILPVFYLLFKERVSQKRSYNLIYLMIVFCVLMHLAFAATGWFYRYESYLVCISLIIVFVSVYKYGSSFFSLRNFSVYLFSAVILFALFFPLVLRSSAGFSKAKQACVNVYEQQYQTASFIKSSYDSAVVAANDIGALSYYTNAKTIDLWGLGNIDVAKSKKEKRCTPQFLDSLVKSKHVQLAIVYDEWFDSALLSNWTKVATWTVRDNVILGGDTVSFYTINKEDAPDLEKKLQTFESSLPKNILVKYSNE